MAVRTTEPFGRSLRALLHDRGMSVSELARGVGLDDGHLTRLLNHRTSGHHVTGDVARRISEYLDLDVGYFAEAREAALVDYLRANPDWRDDTYDALEASGQLDREHEQSWAVEMQPADGGDVLLRLYASWVGARVAFIRLKGPRRLVRVERHGASWRIIETIEVVTADEGPPDNPGAP